MHDEIDRFNETLRDAGAWIARQRWFGEKTRAIVAVEPEVEWLVTAEDVLFALATVQLHFADGGTSRYFLPVAIVPVGIQVPTHAVLVSLANDRRVVDALYTPAVHRWLMERMTQGGQMTGPATAWRWSHIGEDVSTLQRAATLSARVLTGEQSNSTLLFGDALILKVFRRLEPGINPDVEIGAYLTANFPSVPVPKAFGEGNLTMSGATFTIAAAQEFIPNDGDCWRWLVQVLQDGNDGEIAEAARTIALLGTRTGELHMALGALTEDKAFQPEPIDQAYCDRWRTSLQHEIDLTVHLLRQGGHLGTSQDLAHRLAARLDDVDLLRGAEATRVHGDYHLGQVLRTRDGDVSILDFEGEPSRPIADRRRRYSPLKDVAGMTRSLDYARATVRRAPGRSFANDADLDAWFARVRTDFVTAWRAATSASGGQLAPLADSACRKTLEMFELEKALYETRYELNNRPDWIDIPYEAVREIAARGA